MTASVQTLLLATAALALASACCTGFGRRQRRHAGWGWWVLALWLTTLGALFGALLPVPLALLLSAPLLLQWPVLALAGLRRFQARQALPGNARSDWLVLGLAGATAMGAAAAPAAEQGWMLAACTLVVHLYAATLIFMGPASRESTPVLALGAAIALAALAPALLLLPDAALPQRLATGTAAAALGAVVLAFVAVTLASERTERQLRESRRRLRVLANLDPLTQVPNRRHFQELADDALRRDRPGSAVLLMFDIDHFKLINDQLGHAAGDRALCLVCCAVLEHLRARDVPGRHGGDEFVLMLRHTTTPDAMRVAERIVDAVQTRASSRGLPRLSLSFGMVQLGPEEGMLSALRRADQALYEAKRQGRSRAVAALGDEEQPVFVESRRLGLGVA